MYREQGQDEQATHAFTEAARDFEKAVLHFEAALCIYQTIGDRG